jgi:glutaredoxin
MLTLTLYTKAGCTLCDDVKNYLSLRQRAYPHQLIEVDITRDPTLLARYRFSIPVLECGESRLKAPIINREIEQLLVHNAPID